MVLWINPPSAGVVAGYSAGAEVVISVKPLVGPVLKPPLVEVNASMFTSLCIETVTTSPGETDTVESMGRMLASLPRTGSLIAVTIPEPAPGVDGLEV